MEKCRYKGLEKNFSKYEEIKAVYLFGSYAEGTANKLSDLDLAVLLENGYTSNIKLLLLEELTNKGLDNVDLVILNNLSIVAKHEVVKHNKIIYKRDNFDTGSYFSLVIRKYLDFKPLLYVQRQYLKERILSG